MPRTTDGSIPVRNPADPRAALPTSAVDILGASPRMQRIFRLVAKVAPTDGTVLLIGESGTGKELVARSIHLQSRRAQGRFVAVNMGALPETLVESELFGAAKGAYTGAAADRAGLIEEADHGTLFLDEIGDMPLASQVKLLRTLENNEVRRVGENVLRGVDVRVIAATHRDLKAAVERGTFREDLYYRLNVVQIELPPLRERREDIGLLAAWFLDRTMQRWDRPGLSFSSETADLLERYDYPGNVRELENAVEHAVAVGDGPVLQPADLPSVFRASRLLPEQNAPATGGAPPPPRPREKWTLAEVEREHILGVLARHRGNATATARTLGISRTTLWRKLRGYGVRREDLEDDA
jgi:DNA-binding NtrC family response regulator